jgi:predicted DNA-binding WGR domain protein
MSFSEKADEFAGFPVVEYHPRAGIVLPVMPRLELRSPEGDEFWAISLDRDRITMQSGKVGAAGKTETRKYKTLAAAQEKYRELVGEKATDEEYVRPPVRREFHLASDQRKFWTVALSGAKRSVTSGTTGSGSKSSSKQFKDEAAALADCKKLIAGKVAEGYVEKKADAGDLRAALMASLRDDPDDTASRSAWLDYLSEQGEGPLAAAYRVDTVDYEDDGLARIEAFLADPAACLVRALVVGACWGTEDVDEGSGPIVAALVKARDRLPNLRALFLGDVTYDQCEISWITQSKLTPLFEAFPRLETFRSRGGNDLALKPFRHEKLKSLALEASNLSRKVVQAVGQCDLPALEHLEIWLGTDNYGADTRPSDLAEILRGDRLPSLRYLGLRNSEIADDLPAALAGSPLMKRLRVLDLSLGNLSDRGAEALLNVPGLNRLEKLIINHHFVSPAVVARLKALGVEVDAGDPQVAEDYGDDEEPDRYVAHSE